MLSAALGLLFAALSPALPDGVSSFTLTCLAKAKAGLEAFGGIGGVAPAGASRWWMVSEGRPLIFPVEIDLQAAEWRPRVGRPIAIHGDPRGGEFRKVEALAFCHGRFVIGSEATRAQPLSGGRGEDMRLVVADRRGRYLADLPLPEHYQRRRPGMGSQDYRGIQGLSCSPDGTLLLVSLQRQLLQDGAMALSRQLLYRWQPERQSFVREREFLLPLSLQLGLMDSVLLGNGEGLMLENETKPLQRNTLSRFRLDDGEDSSSCRSLVGCTARPARTTVVLDHIERFAGVDLTANEVQYDAIALGPTLANGRKTVLLVNDDDHCGTISNPGASIAPGFAGTTFTRIVLPPLGNSVGGEGR
jgi:hypothetical protein